MLRVFRKRDDLPTLTLPLVVLIFAVIVGATTAAAAILRDSAGVHTIPAFLAALPLFALAVTAYATLIVLWRRAASMAVSVLSLCAVLPVAGLLTAVVLCLSVYVCAYVYASSVLLRESRFRRVLHLTTAVALCLLAAGILFAGYVWHSVPVARLPAQILDALEQLLARSSFFAAYAAETARSLLLALPALWLMIAEGVACLGDWLCRLLFRLMECERYFLPEADEGITTPRYFGALVMVLSFLLLATSYRRNPLIYTVLTNCLLVLCPPSVYVGLREATMRIRDRLADAYIIGKGHRARTVTLIMLLLVWSMAVLGTATVCFVFAIYGAWHVIKQKKLEKSE